jgi:hypothetical protein
MMKTMKIETLSVRARAWTGLPASLFPVCLQAGARPEVCQQSSAQRERLVEAGYPRFLFRLAASRRAWAGSSGAPRRHD